MPDWFYRTVSRSLLFRLSAPLAQRLALGFIGGVGKLPLGLGGHLIDLLGHMRPVASLRSSLSSVPIPGPVGLGHIVDPKGVALRAWDHFGFGFLEVGPVRAQAVRSHRLERNPEAKTLSLGCPEAGECCTDLVARLRDARAGLRTPLWVRVLIGSSMPPAEAAGWVASSVLELNPYVAGFNLERERGVNETGWDAERWRTFWISLGQALERISIEAPIFWVCDSELFPLLLSLGPELRAFRISGLLLERKQRSSHGCLQGLYEEAALVGQIDSARHTLGPGFPLIVSGGISQPGQVIALLRAGADAVLIDTGFIYSGPGLPKRINEAVAFERAAQELEPFDTIQKFSFNAAWVWTLLLGVGMLIGAMLAIWFALTRVVLPYDEVFCGLSRSQLAALNPRILPFMAHDRMTLAGTMMTIGALYACLSWFGSRAGLHWCRTAVLSSAAVGFFSFFLFLGFDYFDPFHAFVTCILFQIFVQGLVGRMPTSKGVNPGVEVSETREWLLGQWGQFLMVIHASGLMVAGLIIATVGVHDVLVWTDERFLGITLAELRGSAGRVIPLIAHDRATLGGMLLASGLVYLLAAFWGIRRGERWLWHAMVWSAVPAYGAALGVHFYVGYTDALHLLPAFLGLALLLCGSVLLRPWMCSESVRAASTPKPQSPT